jgi:hypothetical protein
MGDINRDGYIDDVDMQLITNAFDSVPGDPTWDSRCDLNGDGVVNIIDASTAGTNHGLNIWDYMGLRGTEPPVPTDEELCLAAGKYWYDNACHLEPLQPPSSGWPAPFDAIANIMTNAWNGILGGIDLLWQGFVGAIGNLWLNIVGGFDSLWRSILVGFDNLWSVFWVYSLPSWEDFARWADSIASWFEVNTGTLWTGIVAAFDNLYHSLCDFLFGVESWILARMYEIIGYWDPETQRWKGGFLGWLWDVQAALISYVWSLFNGFGKWLTDCFDWLHSDVTGWLTGAMMAIPNALVSATAGIWNYFSTEVVAWFSGAHSGFTSAIIHSIADTFGWIFEDISQVVHSMISDILDLFKEHGPITGEEALTVGTLGAGTMVVIGGMTAAVIDACSMNMLGSGIHTFGLARFFTSLINPHMFIDAVLNPVIEKGVKTPISYMYNKMFRTNLPSIQESKQMLLRKKITLDQYRDILAMNGLPDNYVEGHVELTKSIPGSGDLITMVVREAFDPTVLVSAPPLFAQYLELTGFAKEWADRYWTAHFLPISLRQAYDNLYRGFWDKAKFSKLLTIADIHPMWHEDIYKVAFRAPSTRELGYGFDTNVYTVDDIAKYRRYGGLSPEDAQKASTAMVAYRTEAEREALRREALADYVAGLDSEADLRGKLASIGGRPEIIDLWVSRAQYREDRDVKIDLIKVVKDQAIKGIIDEGELRLELSEIGVKASRIEVHVLEVQDKKSKAIKETTAANKQKLTAAQVAKGWELGLIGDSEFVSRLVERNYTEEDAQMLLEISRTPAPISPEEITRRKNAIQARINRINRTYTLMFVQIDSQTTTLSDEIQDTAATLTETLNVYDTELAYLTEEAATAAEVRLPLIRKRIDLVNARRDVIISRADAQLTRLQNNLTASADRKSQLIKNRDAEIGELQKEIQTLPVVQV